LTGREQTELIKNIERCKEQFDDYFLLKITTKEADYLIELLKAHPIRDPRSLGYHDIEEFYKEDTKPYNLDFQLIKNARDKILPLIITDYPDLIAMKKIKKLMEEALPDYEIKCDEENNPSTLLESGHVCVMVKTKTRPDDSYSCIDVTF